MAHLLLFSLGPVQDFIHAARRCQDLWFGSWLLSDLSRAVGEAVLSAGASVRVLFPAGLLDESRSEAADAPGVANLILVELPSDLDPAAVSAAGLQALNVRLNAVVKAAWRSVWTDEAFHRDTALQQVAELMETHWVSTPLEPDFPTARRRLYAQLSAVKNTRQWAQPPWTTPAGVPKDSLSGAREAVVQRSLVQGRSASEWRRLYGLKPGEQLCGVSLLKRLGVAVEDGDAVWAGRGRPAFHSTSHMAAVPVLQALHSAPGGLASMRTYVDTLAELGLDLGRFRVRDAGPPTLAGHDGSLLFESRLDAIFEESSDLDRAARRSAVREAAQALRTLLRVVGRPSGPAPYYAFLLADGDRMGRALDGLSTMEGQAAAGRALNDFAEQCGGIVRDHSGSLIFAGGDDVLALVPLPSALGCARALADAFRDTVQPALDTHWTGSGHPSSAPQASLSVGLALVHAQEDMGHARVLAGRAERLAKRSRNALGVLLVPRSGGERQAGGQWSDPWPVDTRIAAWAAVAGSGDLSNRAAYDLESIATHFDPLPPGEQWKRRAEMRSLVWQALGRKRARGGGTAVPEARDSLEAALSWLEAAQSEPTMPEAGPPLAERLRSSAAELIVGRQVWRASVPTENEETR